VDIVYGADVPYPQFEGQEPPQETIPPAVPFDAHAAALEREAGRLRLVLRGPARAFMGEAVAALRRAPHSRLKEAHPRCRPGPEPWRPCLWTHRSMLLGSRYGFRYNAQHLRRRCEYRG
jgi:hypothetical protein